MNKEARNIAYGLIYASVLIIICVIIRPHGLAANDGLSYFGGLKVTVIPYALSFLMYAFFCWEVAASLGSKQRADRIMSYSLKLMAVLLGGLVVTPHNFVITIHTYIGTALFFYQLIFSFWLVGTLMRNWKGVILVAIEFLSGLAALYYLPKPYGLLLQSQVIYQLAFGLLLINALNLRLQQKKVRKN